MAGRFITLTGADGDVLLEAGTREEDPSREYWLLEDGPKGWAGGTAPRGSLTDRMGRGAFPAVRPHGARGLELKVRIHLGSYELVSMERRRLSGVLAGGELGELMVDAAGVGPLSARVQRDGDVLFARVSPTTFDVSIPLIAPDSELYGPWRVTTLRPIGAGVGLEYALFSVGGVLTFGSDVSSEDWVWNDGNTVSRPRFVVQGTAPGGFRVGIGGRFVEWPRPVFPGAPVTVDMAGSVLLGGIDQSQFLTARNWAEVGPVSVAQPVFELLQGGDAWCEVHHRDTYM